MPPIRTGSSPKSTNQDGKILLALNDIKNGRIKSIHAAAKLYEIPYTTLYTRSHGRVSRADIRPNGHKLTQFEEDSLAEWIISMDTRGAAPRPATVGEMANILLAARGSYPPSTVGKNWPSIFINCRPELRTRFSRRYDYQRALNEDPKSIRQWLATVQNVIDENGIQPEDIYNFDETGFAMDFIANQKIVIRAEYNSRRSLLQPEYREWITVIEAICADSYSLSLYIIFKGKVVQTG
ncbi:DNA binding HTH domain Psq-type [Penicillium hetheringtonii]|uniref:DNA binding HTH domain Psq-type n=1 Tax=Penicillium hetheringtonii TaxID=911720 RepID=A0AAD6DQ34_9EURO|nr:DNA binding HTH domain Psq-type [Penicillium hetheringtonii]